MKALPPKFLACGFVLLSFGCATHAIGSPKRVPPTSDTATLRAERVTEHNWAHRRYLVQAIDLGRGAALLIDAGVIVLVDAGASDDARNTTHYSESHLVAYLARALGARPSQRCAQERGQSESSPPGSRPVIDHVVITTIDSLHSNQLDEVLECFEVKNVWLPRLTGEEEPDATRFLRATRNYPGLRIHAPEIPSADTLSRIGLAADRASAWERAEAQLQLGSELTARVNHSGRDSCYVFELAEVNVLAARAQASCLDGLKPLLRSSKPLWLQGVAARHYDLIDAATWWVPTPDSGSSSDADSVVWGGDRSAGSQAEHPVVLRLDDSALGCSERPIGPIGVEAAGCDNWGLWLDTEPKGPVAAIGGGKSAYRGPPRYETREILLQSAFPGYGTVRRDFLPGLPQQLELELSAPRIEHSGKDDLDSVVELRPVRDGMLRQALETLPGIGLHACETRKGRVCTYIQVILEAPGQYLPEPLQDHLADENVKRLLARCSIAVDNEGKPRGEPQNVCRLVAVTTDQDVYEVISAVAGETGGVGAGGSVVAGMGVIGGSGARQPTVDKSFREEILRKASQLFYRQLGAPPFNATPLTGNPLEEDEFEVRSSDTLSAILGAPAIEHATYGLRVILEDGSVKLRIRLELMIKNNRSAEYYIDASPEHLRAYVTRLEKTNEVLLAQLCRAIKGRLIEGRCIE